MGIKSFLVKPFANRTVKSIRKWADRAVDIQETIFHNLIKKAANTTFGRDHDFSGIKSHDDFKERVPIKDYEGIRGYVEQIIEGQSDVLWPGKPAYFAKTSGTTSGVKYIPISKDSLPSHVGTSRIAAFNYIGKTGNGKFLDGKMIFLSGSPELIQKGGVNTGRLSGIVNHHVPSWLRTNQLPSFETNCIEEWEEKLEKVIDETINQDMRMISGIPPWVQMYYERLVERSGKGTIKELFPNFSLFVYGGVNYEPYRASMERLIGERIDSLETYPASEGFVAFQDCFPHEGLLLNVNAGMFFEFVPAEEVFNENPTRLSLGEVEKDINYALIINSNAGLWGYNLGDTVAFTSLNPYRLKVTGRIKHFISAFGEHVIGKEVEEALFEAAAEAGVQVVEFTVAPQVNPPEGGLPYHEWFIEFEQPPTALDQFAKRVDELMEKQNIYYADLTRGKILRPLKISVLEKNAFRNYMKSKGKLGGQNKVPRLANDRSLADELIAYQKKTTP